MKPKRIKRLRITERDYLLANRKAAREEEILAHGKPVSFRSHFHKIKKKYDRKQLKKVISDTTDDGFFIHPLAYLQRTSTTKYLTDHNSVSQLHKCNDFSVNFFAPNQ